MTCGRVCAADSLPNTETEWVRASAPCDARGWPIVNSMTIPTATIPSTRPRVLVASAARLTVEALNARAAVSPLTCDCAALAPRHNSMQTPIHALRVRTVVGSATGAFPAAGAGFGSYTSRKQSRPPRGTPR